MSRPQFPVILTEKKILDTNTLELGFQFEGRVDFQYQAGQFVQLLFHCADTICKRSYSIACSPVSFQTHQILTIAISLVDQGLASGFFREARPGIRLNLTGPFGALVLPEMLPGQLILAGTGTGIVPYRSMIPQLQQLGAQGQAIRVLMGCRYRRERLYHEDFKQLTAHCPTIDYRVCLSREAPCDPEEHAGYIQQQFSQLSLQSEQDTVFLCGNPAMVDEAAAWLKAAGFDSRQVRREKYVYSGH